MASLGDSSQRRLEGGRVQCMTSGQPPWLLSDGLPSWRPLAGWTEEILKELPWIPTGEEYLRKVEELREGDIRDVRGQMKAWQKSQQRHVSPFKTWKPSNRKRAGQAYKDLADSEEILAWWVDRIKSFADAFKAFGESRMLAGAIPEYIPGTEPSTQNTELVEVWGRLLAQFAGEFHGGYGSSTRSRPVKVFVVESRPGPARVLYVGAGPDVKPTLDMIAEFEFPPFVRDLARASWNRSGERQLSLVRTNPDTGKPLKGNPTVTQLKRNLVEQHRRVPVPRTAS